MPISLQARWTRSAISPRLAMRIFSNIAPLLDDDQRLAELHGLAVLDQDLGTVPALGAGIGFMVFIASMISRVWPAAPCRRP